MKFFSFFLNVLLVKLPFIYSLKVFWYNDSNHLKLMDDYCKFNNINALNAKVNVIDEDKSVLLRQINLNSLYDTEIRIFFDNDKKVLNNFKNYTNGTDICIYCEEDKTRVLEKRCLSSKIYVDGSLFFKIQVSRRLKPRFSPYRSKEKSSNHSKSNEGLGKLAIIGIMGLVSTVAMILFMLLCGKCFSRNVRKYVKDDLESVRSA